MASPKCTLLGSSAATQEEVTLSPYSRGLGSYVIGLTGTGKTTFLLSVVLQDIAAGDGVCVLDPHGDLLQKILQSDELGERLRRKGLTRERAAQEVIVFEPFEIERPFGLNLFECENLRDPNLVDRISSEVMGTFYKLFHDSWGPQMEDLLRVISLTLIYNQDLPEQLRPTMAEIPTLLTNADYRDFLVNHMPRGHKARLFWEETYNPLLTKDRRVSRDMLEYHRSSLNKVRRFLLNTTILNIVGQPGSSFDFRAVMDRGQVLLVNLSKGRLGEDNSALLGSVLVGKILIAALSRADVAEEERKPFHLIVDEFQSFATSSFPAFQAEARKYKIDTVVAHQYRDQLDFDNKGSSLTVGNKIIFRVNGMDAGLLAKEFDNTPPPPEKTMQAKFRPYASAPNGELLFIRHDSPDGMGTVFHEIELPRRPYSDVEGETANKLATLPQYTARVKIVDEAGGLKEFTIQSREPKIPSDAEAMERAREIRKHSRQTYGRDRATVEAEIRSRTGEFGGDGEATTYLEKG
jgi:hypothetical protein